MSTSDMDLRTILAHSSEADPVEALRDALSDIRDGLIAAGCGPHHLRDMIWETGRPEAFHPSRRTVDLAYREVLAGFRPPIRLQPAPQPGLTVRARHVVPTVDTTTDGDALRELARQYSPRLQADMKALFRQWTHEGEAFRSDHAGLDLAYGLGCFETLDLYRPSGGGRAPIFVFIHGGYWQATDKAQYAHFARGLLHAGYAVAMPNYGLAPETPLEAGLAQIVAALNFLVREAGMLGLDPGRLHISGTSAGGHLAAMALCAADAPPIVSALLLSGLHDLRPLGPLPQGRLLGLDNVAHATRLSPVAQPRPPSTRIAIAVGEGESEAFKAQSVALAQGWQETAPLICPGNHFSLLDGLNGGVLLELALRTAEDR